MPGLLPIYDDGSTPSARMSARRSPRASVVMLQAGKRRNL
jgi:hypothetical protein